MKSAFDSIPETELDELVPNHPHEIVYRDLGYVDGQMPTNDLIPFLKLFSSVCPAEALEIGTYFGTTTAMMTLNSPGTIIHTLDLPLDFDETEADEYTDMHLLKRRVVGEAFKMVDSTKICQHFGDSATWDYSNAKNATFALIDGCHSYEYVKNDTDNVIKHCAKPLTIVWHDCDVAHHDVVRWLSEMVADGHSVKRIRGTNLAVLVVA